MSVALSHLLTQMNGPETELRAVVPAPVADAPVRAIRLGIDDGASDAVEGTVAIVAGTPAPAALAALAERGAVALVVAAADEVPAVGPARAASARDHGLALVAARAPGGAPAIAERLRLALADAEAARLRELDAFTQTLLAELRAGRGLRGLVEAAAAALGAPVVLTSAGRRVVALAGTDDDAAVVLDATAVVVAVRVRGRPWGGLATTALAAPGATSVRERLERLASIAELELLRDSEQLAPEHRARREVLVDLLAGRDGARLQPRIELLGVRVTAGVAVVALALDRAVFALDDVERTLAGAGANALSGTLDEDVLVVALVPEASGGERAEMLAGRLASLAGVHASRAVLAVGPVTHGLDTAGRALREARRTLAIARATPGRGPVVRADALVVDRMLARAVEDAEIAQTVREVLAPLRAGRPERAGTLLETMSVFLDAGGSKTDAAHRLGIRRQSLYGRLEELDALVGPLHDPERRLALQIALRAGRLLDALAPAGRDGP